MFSTIPKTIFNILVTFILSSACALNLDLCKILSFGKELNHYHTIPPFDTLYGTYFPFQTHCKMLSAICFNLDQSEILSSGNGLRVKLSSAIALNLDHSKIQSLSKLYEMNFFYSCIQQRQSHNLHFHIEISGFRYYSIYIR